MKFNFKHTLVTTAVVAAFFCAAGCKTPASHPNQLSTFDGMAYDSLTVTRAALQSMRAPIAAQYPMYVPVFNQIATAYNEATAMYGLYHGGRKTEGEVTSAVQQMVLSFLLLDTKLLTQLGSSSASSPHAISSLQLITELQFLAAVAAKVPAVAPEANLAEIILAGSAQADLAFEAIKNQPIDETTLVRVAVIS